MPAIYRGHYYEARFKTAPGKYRTVYDEFGKPVRYATKELAQTACQETEIEYRLLGTANSAPVMQAAVPGSAPPVLASFVQSTPDPGDERFEDFVEVWLDDQDLADTTFYNYQSHI